MNLEKLIPALTWLKNYKSRYLYFDFVAGVSLGVSMIPKAMAYALVAGLPPIYGLYASFVAPLVSILFGSNRLLFTGPVGVMTMLVFTALSPIAQPGSNEYVSLAALLSLMVGVIILSIAVLHLTFILHLISHAAVIGFVNAAALIITITQLRYILGLHGSNEDYVILMLLNVVNNLSNINVLVFSLSLASFLVMIFVRKRYPKFPDIITMLIFFTFVVYLFGMEKTGVEIVGALPKGFPMPTLPDITGFSNIPGLLLSAALIAIVGMTETYSISKIIIYHTKEKVDFEQEFRAQGLANILTSLFQGYPVCGSFSGTSVNWSSGARTGMSIIIFSFFVLLSITVLTPLFYYLPKFILAVIVILAVMKLFKPRQLLEIYRINRYDGLVAFTTFGVSIITKPDTGLIVGVVLALALHLWKTMHTKIYFTVRDKETGYFISIPEEPKSWCDQLFIIKPEGPFIFVNAEQIRDEILHLVEKCNRMKCLIIDMAAVYYMDTSGIEALRDLVDEMERRNIRLILIHVEEEIVNSLSKEGLIEHLEVHETKKEAISSAFNYYLDKSICRECSKNVFNECEKVRVS